MTSVLMVTKYFPPVSYGGTEKYVEVTSRKLSEKGLNVTIIGPSKGKKITYEQLGNVLICRVPIFQLNFVDFSISMKNCVKSLSYDIVHFNTFSTLCRFVRPALTSPFVITTHGFFWKKPSLANPVNYVFKMNFLKDNFSKSHGIFCVSKKDFENVRNMFGYAPTKLHYLPNGVDLKKFSNHKKDATKAKYGFENKLIITQVGRFTPKKGQHVLLNALKLMPKQTRDRSITILAGYPFDADYFLTLEHEIKLSNLEKNVKLWSDVSDSLLVDLYAMTDIFVLPSFVEGLPLTLLEAWASKCAVVVTDVGGLPYVVQDQIDGFVVPSNNSRILSQKIIELVCDEEKRKLFSERGFERAKKEFNIDDNIDFLIEQYAQIIESNR